VKHQVQMILIDRAHYHSGVMRCTRSCRFGPKSSLRLSQADANHSVP
jgi:hypothetical protein